MLDLKSFQIALLAWGGLFCLILFTVIRVIAPLDVVKNKLYSFLLIFTAIYLFSDCFAWYFRGMPGLAGYIGVRLSNGINFISDYLLILTFHLLICYCLFYNDFKYYKLIRIKAVYLICFIGILMVILNHFYGFLYYFDANNTYYRGPYTLLYAYSCFSIILIDLSLLIQYRNRFKSKIILNFMILYCISPFIAGIIQSFNYGLSLTGIAISVSTVCILCTELIDTSQRLLRKEKETSEMKVALTLSQIAPHFIYNTLTTIKRLCVKDPILAQETITNFSNFLRLNIEAIQENKPILFLKELEHVKNYVFVEKLRFGDKFEIQYDIEEDNFLLPALCLQVLVENSIKHGICKKEENGMIYIHSYKTLDNIIIEVKDDGIGFDANDKSKYHIGLNSTITRLESMCNGKFEISSEIGKGTIARIILPKGEGYSDENSCSR